MDVHLPSDLTASSLSDVSGLDDPNDENYAPTGKIMFFSTAYTLRSANQAPGQPSLAGLTRESESDSCLALVDDEDSLPAKRLKFSDLSSDPIDSPDHALSANSSSPHNSSARSLKLNIGKLLNEKLSDCDVGSETEETGEVPGVTCLTPPPQLSPIQHGHSSPNKSPSIQEDSGAGETRLREALAPSGPTCAEMAPPPTSNPLASQTEGECLDDNDQGEGSQNSVINADKKSSSNRQRNVKRSRKARKKNPTVVFI